MASIEETKDKPKENDENVSKLTKFATLWQELTGAQIPVANVLHFKNVSASPADPTVGGGHHASCLIDTRHSGSESQSTLCTSLRVEHVHFYPGSGLRTSTFLFALLCCI
jgi:hypothetical protein